MGHVPHVYVPAPWSGPHLELPPSARQHLTRVMRHRPGDPVSYTDGAGTTGDGVLAGGGIERGDEATLPAAQPPVTVVVAPPRAAERARFLVEKLAELGVDHLLWLTTVFGGGRPPRQDRAAAWAIGALEQSRGAFLLDIGGPVTFAQLYTQILPSHPWVAVPGGGPAPTADGPVTVVVGGEGGFAPAEVPDTARPVGLGSRILRVESAAVVASVIALQAVGRLPVPSQKDANSGT